MLILKEGTRPPWVGLGASVWVQIAAGNAYNFPLYSHSLKSVLGFNQLQLTLLGVANDIGENVGILPGLVSNKLPPWMVLLIGALACFFGYGVIWLSLSRTVQSLPFWLLWVALSVATNSSAWFTTAVLVTNMRNFPLSRGMVAAILKGYGGLSGAVFTEIFSIILQNSSANLLLFLALGVPLLCISMMYFVRPCTPASGEDPSEKGRFHFTLAASVVLGIFLLTTTILNDILHLNTLISYVLVGVMVLLLMAPLMIPVKMTWCRMPVGTEEKIVQSAESLETQIQANNGGELVEQLLESSSSRVNLEGSSESEDVSEVAMLLAEGEGAVKKKRRPKRGEDFTFTEAIVKADFWLLFLVNFVGVGTGVTALNNLAQIGIAQGVYDTTSLLSLFSFCNFVGRLSGGVVSEHFVRTRTVPRTIWMTLTLLVMIVTYLLFASAIDGTLYPATALLGICYGTQISVMVATVSEIFGLKHFGVLYNVMSLGNPLGACLFSVLLAGYIYDNEASKQHKLDPTGSNLSCLGANCFRVTFEVLAGVCAVGCILSIILTRRIRPVYQMLYSGGSFRLPQSSSR